MLCDPIPPVIRSATLKIAESECTALRNSATHAYAPFIALNSINPLLCRSPAGQRGQNWTPHGRNTPALPYEDARKAGGLGHPVQYSPNWDAGVGCQEKALALQAVERISSKLFLEDVDAGGDARHA